MKAITAKQAEKLLKKLGLTSVDNGVTFYATSDDESAVWEFDSKKERDAFVDKNKLWK